MYKKGIYKILANEPLTATVWRMVLGGDTQWITAPGQFVEIAVQQYVNYVGLYKALGGGW